MTCWAPVDLPLVLVDDAARRWPGTTVAEAVHGDAYCHETTDHGARPHRSCLDSTGPYSAVWVEWQAGQTPTLVELPDCTVRGDDGDACCLYETHDGPHTWQGRDG
ncbi:hypothetical protein [Streptomyces sp. enrichment culture]|uniref:hypothetical protein n=1 Tax=Streptomyces sp. enrichment culture TaxID=1795815 RepID=UPI003F567EA4